MTPLLEVRKLSAGYGKSLALTEVSLVVPTGSIVTVIGPNGAGKSTLLNTIMGVVRGHGQVMLDGKPLGNAPVDTRVMAGISLVPERRDLFHDMPVADNLLLGSFPRKRRGDRNSADQLDWVYELFPRLRERRAQLAGTLSGGERQMLAVGRALMAKPRLLLLDEPSLGLAPLIVKDVLQVVGRLRDHGVSTLLVEQNARAALQLSDYGYVLENGAVALQGAAKELRDNALIIRSYLGLAKASPAQPAHQKEIA